MEMNVDVLIAGSGVSGLYCALNLNKNLNVLLISKSKLTDTNTYLAQGGIATARSKDDIPSFIEDTLKAGKYKNKLESVKVLAEESIENIDNLMNIGMNLDKSENKILYTREGAHSINRIVHSKDHTGEIVADTLINEVKKHENITIYEDTYLCDLININNKCVGGIIFKDGKQINIHSKVVVLATGGIGGLFKNSTNQRIMTGDGIAIALRNNVKLENLQYIQFHPTALYEKNTDAKRFLISEAVRGEGGLLFNSKGERFVNELLPRDVVSKAIYGEIKKFKVPYVNLDISFKDKDYIENRFPSIYNHCFEKGINITKEPIPVSPAQHYFMGGISVDLYSKTSMENLYAVGEISCTGVHGANRLASNSLLEGLVFSRRAAISINNEIANIKLHKIEAEKTFTKCEVENLKKENRKIVIQELKRRSEDLHDELFKY